MRETEIPFAGQAPGTVHTLRVFAFGTPGARPHVHVQAGLHADEGPGMMAARILVDRLAEAEAQGLVRGSVTVLPAANPVGLGQFVNGDHSGRFDLYDGRNFNRDCPDLAPAAAAALKGRLGHDAATNAAPVRAALRAALEREAAPGVSDRLRRHLMALGLEADIVLDLHCDGEAEVHLYTQPASLDRLMPLAALLGCRAVLIAEVSGGNPFDEALSRPWIDLATRLGAPIPAACATATVELRGRSDVSRALGAADAAALMGYLTHLGVLAGTVDLPEPLCAPTPLSGSEALVAPVAGLLSYRAAVGDRVSVGDIMAEITDLATGAVTAVPARTSGVFYARPATRIAEPGKRLGKIAGAEPFRHGPLLSP